MAPQAPQNQDRPRRRSGAALLTAATLYTLTSGAVLFLFLVRPGLAGHPRADFPEQVYATAHKPYVGRALVPAAVRVLTAALPESVARYATTQLRERRLTRLLGWQDAYLPEYAVAVLVLLACLVGFAFALRSLTRHFFDFPPVLADLGPVLGLLFVPLFFRYYSYLYDPGTLLTFTLGALAIAKGRFVGIAAALVLATINKETAILLVPLFAVNEWLCRRRVPMWRAAVLFALWGVTRGALALVFAGNPGVSFEQHFREHTVWLFTKFPMALRYFLAVVVLFALFAGHRWREKPVFARAGLVITAAPLFAASLIFGFADELRGYYEAYPFLYILMLPSIYRFLGYLEREGGIL